MNSPRLIVIAGPNGSGKSTLIEQLQRQGLSFGRYINADDIARERGLVGDDGARAAQSIADSLRDQCLKAAADFSFETVMSHPSKVEFMRLAKDRGFQVSLFFVATADPLINITRVQNRVDKGGHDVPHDRIVARYERALGLLPSAVSVADVSTIFDNTRLGEAGMSTMRVVARCLNARGSLTISLMDPVPPWLSAHLLDERNLARFKQNGLAVTINR